MNDNCDKVTSLEPKVQDKLTEQVMKEFWNKSDDKKMKCDKCGQRYVTYEECYYTRDDLRRALVRMKDKMISKIKEICESHPSETLHRLNGKKEKIYRIYESELQKLRQEAGR